MIDRQQSDIFQSEKVARPIRQYNLYFRSYNGIHRKKWSVMSLISNTWSVWHILKLEINKICVSGRSNRDANLIWFKHNSSSVWVSWAAIKIQLLHEWSFNIDIPNDESFAWHNIVPVIFYPSHVFVHRQWHEYPNHKGADNLIVEVNKTAF